MIDYVKGDTNAVLDDFMDTLRRQHENRNNTKASSKPVEVQRDTVQVTDKMGRSRVVTLNDSAFEGLTFMEKNFLANNYPDIYEKYASRRRAKVNREHDEKMRGFS